MLLDKIYTMDEISNLVRDILASNDVKCAYLFGSYSRGNQTAKSDIDMVVEFEVKKSLFEVCGILYDIRERLHKEVDFFDMAEIAQHPALLQRLQREGVCIYEKQ